MNEYQDDDDIIGAYSFGIRFYYWPWFKNRPESDGRNPGYKQSD